MLIGYARVSRENELFLYHLSSLDGSSAQVRLGKKQFKLFPGEQISLSRGDNTSSESVHPVRNQCALMVNGTKVKIAEFSMSSLILCNSSLKKAMKNKSKAGKTIANQILKTGAALSIATVGHGPFKEQK